MLSDMQILVEFARSKNMIEAANKLGLSQGSVSMRLKHLEERIGQTLFEMDGKKKVLTPFGAEMARIATEAYQRLQIELMEASDRLANPDRLAIRIGCRKEIFDRLVTRFKVENPLIFQDMNHLQVVAALHSRSIDLGITHQVPDSAELIARKLFSNHTVIGAHKKWGHHFDDPEWLKNTPALIYKLKDPPFIETYLAKYGLMLNHVRVAGVCESWPALRSMLEEGKGFCLMPSEFQGKGGDCRFVDVDRNILPEQNFHLIYRKSSPLKKILSHLKF